MCSGEGVNNSEQSPLDNNAEAFKKRRRPAKQASSLQKRGLTPKLLLAGSDSPFSVHTIPTILQGVGGKRSRD